MAKTQPRVIVGGGSGSGGFSFKLSTGQQKNVQQVLGKTKSVEKSAASKASPKKPDK
jgi:hypothetical protein